MSSAARRSPPRRTARARSSQQPPADRSARPAYHFADLVERRRRDVEHHQPVRPRLDARRRLGRDDLAALQAAVEQLQLAALGVLEGDVESEGDLPARFRPAIRVRQEIMAWAVDVAAPLDDLESLA